MNKKKNEKKKKNNTKEIKITLLVYFFLLCVSRSIPRAIAKEQKNPPSTQQTHKKNGAFLIYDLVITCWIEN